APRAAPRPEQAPRTRPVHRALRGVAGGRHRRLPLAPVTEVPEEPAPGRPVVGGPAHRGPPAGPRGGRRRPAPDPRRGTPELEGGGGPRHRDRPDARLLRGDGAPPRPARR